MFKLSKKTEYGLLALQYMLMHSRQVATVREIAEYHNISKTLLAKILQGLVKSDIVESVQGAQGGYSIKRDAGKISIAAVMEAIEGPVHITDCYYNDSCCDRYDVCSLKDRFVPLQNGIIQQLNNVSLAEFLKE